MFIDLMPQSVFPCGRCKKNGDAANYYIRELDDGSIRLECARCGGCCPRLYGEDARTVVECWEQVRSSLDRMNKVIRAAREKMEKRS